MKDFIDVLNTSGFLAIGAMFFYLGLANIEKITKFIENMRFRDDPRLIETLKSQLLPIDTQDILIERFADVEFARAFRISVRGRKHREAIIRMVTDSEGYVTYGDIRKSQHSMRFDAKLGRFKAHLNWFNRITGKIFMGIFYITLFIFLFSAVLFVFDYSDDYKVDIKGAVNLFSYFILLIALTMATKIVNTSIRIDDWIRDHQSGE